MNAEDDKGSSNVVKAAPVQGDLRRVEYSTEMEEVGFPPQSRIKGTLFGMTKLT